MVEELKNQFREIEAELDALATRARAFRLAHFVLLGGRLCLQSDGVTNAASLEREWHALCRAHDRLISRRNDILHRWAIIQEKMQDPVNA